MSVRTLMLKSVTVMADTQTLRTPIGGHRQRIGLVNAGKRTLIATALAAMALPLHAQEGASPVNFHGFGSWAYGRTTDNNFLGGTPEGDYRHVTMTANISKSIDDRLAIHAQGEIREDEDNAHVSLSYAFADYKLSDRLSLRVGQVKHPFGIYTEVFDVDDDHADVAVPIRRSVEGRLDGAHNLRLLLAELAVDDLGCGPRQDDLDPLGRHD